MPKNRYAQVIAEQIKKARQETKDKCWERLVEVVNLLMVAVTVELNGQCGLGKERIMRVNEAMNKILADYGEADDKGYFMHCLERDYKRIMGTEHKNMPGTELEIEW